MNEQLQLIISQLRMIWLYRWLVLIVAVALSAIGTIVVYTLPNQFTVSATIFVDTGSMLRSLLKGMTVGGDTVRSAALLMRQTLLTRPNLEQVARRADLDLNAKTPEDFDSLITDLGSDIAIANTKREDIFQLSYTSSNAKAAKKLVDELLNTFLESTLGSSRKDKVVTEKFLDDQIAEYERRLVEAEDRLKQFKQKNVGLMPTAQMDYFERLAATQSALKETELAVQESEQRRDALARQLAAAEATGGDDEVLFGMGDTSNIVTPQTSQYDARVQGLEMKLDELLLRFTEQHPDVVALRAIVAELEARREKEAQSAVIATPSLGETPAESEVSRHLKVTLSEADANVAAMRSRLKEHQRRVDELKHLVDTVPEVEAELKRLDRDYGLNKQQYQELLQRREAARLTQQAQESTDDVQLKVIEPPRLPLTPSGPNRILLTSGVFGASIGFGAALAWLMAQIKPRVFTARELKQLLSIPILGTVSLIGSRWANPHYRLEHGVFALVCVALLVIYLTLVTLGMMNIDLHAKALALTERIL